MKFKSNPATIICKQNEIIEIRINSVGTFHNFLYSFDDEKSFLDKNQSIKFRYHPSLNFLEFYFYFSDLENGTYFLQISGEIGETITKKIEQKKGVNSQIFLLNLEGDEDIDFEEDFSGNDFIGDEQIDSEKKFDFDKNSVPEKGSVEEEAEECGLEGDPDIDFPEEAEEMYGDEDIDFEEGSF